MRNEEKRKWISYCQALQTALSTELTNGGVERSRRTDTCLRVLRQAIKNLEKGEDLANTTFAVGGISNEMYLLWEIEVQQQDGVWVIKTPKTKK